MYLYRGHKADKSNLIGVFDATLNDEAAKTYIAGNGGDPGIYFATWYDKNKKPKRRHYTLNPAQLAEYQKKYMLENNVESVEAEILPNNNHFGGGSSNLETHLMKMLEDSIGGLYEEIEDLKELIIESLDKAPEPEKQDNWSGMISQFMNGMNQNKQQSPPPASDPAGSPEGQGSGMDADDLKAWEDHKAKSQN